MSGFDSNGQVVLDADKSNYGGHTIWGDFAEFFGGEANSNSSAGQARAAAERNYDFNSAEAQKNRDWQEYMSNSAHQREVADLQAAGLNPILSAMNGSGAATPSGAVGASGATSANKSYNSSYNGMFTRLFSSIVNATSAGKQRHSTEEISKANRQADAALKSSKASSNLANAAYLAKLVSKM